jgi:bacterioferritin-associated ferredoxin
VTRAAFAIMVKFTDLSDSFAMLLEEVQMEMDVAADEAECSKKVRAIVNEQASRFA